MNFLAHLHVADPDPESLVGNLIADFVKGPAVAVLPAGVQSGVRQHRLVDAFTDRHPLVQRSIGRIGEKWGWFSGIVIDVYYDHVLARAWDRYSAEPLRAFADRMYGVVRDGVRHVHPDARPFFERFVADDRLAGYATEAGMIDTLARLSRRIAERMPTRAVRLEAAWLDLIAAAPELAADFHEFYPQLVAAARRFTTPPPHDPTT